MKTIYVLTAWNPNRHGCNIQPFNTIKELSKQVDLLATKGFIEFLSEKREVSQ